LLGAALLAFCGSAAALTEPEVRAVAEAAESAAERNDVAGMAAYLSEDAIITVVAPKPDGSSETKSSTKSEFVAGEIEAHAKARNRRYQSDVTRIVMAPDGQSGKAHVRAEESLVSDGHAVLASAEQVMTIQMRGGVAKITAASTRVTSFKIDGVKIF